tara:strand:- start:1813 stop:3792 length:1980 start_codon:yes stop_codon:yes gene_type:complete
MSKPLISADQSLPEITIKAIILGIILTIVMTASNAYLALKLGQTISASIPAAIVSLAILRFFRRHNVLESNLVQTAASAGEVLVGGIAFTTPALLMMNIWHDFNYWEIVLISIIGGTLGVLFSIPLRRILLADKTLRFPEGTAIGHVLKTASQAGAGLKHLVLGGIVGGLIAFAQTGLGVLTDGVTWWWKKSAVVFGFGFGFSPAVIAAGYIVGINVALAAFIGWVISWIISMPILSHLHPVSAHLSAFDASDYIWAKYIRFIGVGTMLVGGIWTLLTLLKPVFQGLKASVVALRDVKLAGGFASIPRTERDIPINYVFWTILLVAVPLAFYLLTKIDPAVFGISVGLRIAITIVFTLFVIIIGFFAASISGFFAGMFGASNSPLSGIMLSVLVVAGFLMYGLLSLGTSFAHHPDKIIHGGALVIFITAIIIIGAALSLDTMQDLKAGQMVGATPWKQQLMLVLGVVVSALVAPFVMRLLFHAYGIIGVAAPHAGMDPQHMLSAPQGGMVSAIATGVFGGNLPWSMIITGGLIAVFFIIVDELLKLKKLRMPVLAVGVGIYLPLTTTASLVAGGLVSYLVQRHRRQRKQQPHKHQDILLACGIIAGSTLMGVILAVPFVIFKSSSILVIMPHNLTGVAETLGGIVTLMLLGWIYRTAVR